MEQLSKTSREQLITKHIPFATRVARRFARRRKQFGVDWDELRSAALLGLVDAAQRYEPAHGVAFDAFSHARIRGAMVDLLRRGGWNNSAYLRFALERETDRFSSELVVSEPRSLLHAKNAAEFAAAVNAIEELPMELTVRKTEANNDAVDLVYAGKTCPETQAIQTSLRSYLLAVFERLRPDERNVLRLHYFEGRSFEQMRFFFGGLSKATLSRLHRRALESLRTLLEADCERCTDRATAGDLAIRNARSYYTAMRDGAER